MPRSNTPASDALPIDRRILLTAHDLFYREGIRATGVDRLIAESGVAKRTFYKYYPTKNDLVLSFLEYRHRHWMRWFEDALRRHGGAPRAIAPALREWFATEAYRGCAFINAVVELGESFPEAVAVSRRHKADMAAVIAALLPRTPDRAAKARALAIAIDGAIVNAQFGVPLEDVLEGLALLVEAASSPRQSRVSSARFSSSAPSVQAAPDSR